MGAFDITRQLQQPNKGYTRASLFQGAILTDADFNEGLWLEQATRHKTFIETVGGVGTSDNGFKITSVTTNTGPGGYCFDIQFDKGSMFLGGHQFCMDQPFTLASQPDWIQNSEGDLPNMPSTEDALKHLVWLKGWEQGVTAREDSELLEQVFHGVETSGRFKLLARAGVFATDKDDCGEAFDDYIATLVAEGADYEAETCAIVGNTKMRVTPYPVTINNNLCTPHNKSGFHHAENETIRVQIVRPGKFIWGLSNAAPLYRIRLATIPAGGLRLVSMMTPPWDQVSQPKTGDIVEIIAWGSQLDNEEKIAERTGIFARVTRSYSRESLSFEIEDKDATLIPMNEWVNTGSGTTYQSSRDGAGDSAYLYMRVWRGTMFPAAHDFLDMSTTAPTPLGETGLAVQFNAQGRTGDYYIFSARPETPDEVVPWNFMDGDGAAPTGPIEYVTALGLLDWGRENSDASIPYFEDCRRRFRRLNTMPGCCEVTVGDGVHSHGDFTSIQAAIEALPAEGGKICVLRGIYEEVLDIQNRRKVIVEGCGKHTHLVLPTDQRRSLIAIEDSQFITIRGMRLTALHDIAVNATGSADPLDKPEVLSHDISLSGLLITARDAAAVFASPTDRLELFDCDILFAPLESSIQLPDDGALLPGVMPGVILSGTDLRVEGCTIEGQAVLRPLRPFGGIHILEGSRAIRIRRNRISKISGMGIALGSWEEVAAKPAGEVASSGAVAHSTERKRRSAPGRAWHTYEAVGAESYKPDPMIFVTDDGCGEFDPNPPITENDPDQPPKVDIDTGDPIEFIEIVDNDITDTGLSGISVTRFFSLATHSTMITVRGMLIRENRLTKTSQYPLPVLNGSMALHSGYGGIALSSVEHGDISENRLSHCGGNPISPYAGIYILRATGVTIDRNHITETGTTPTAGTPIEFGQRGGVVISMASPPQIQYPALQETLGRTENNINWRSVTGEPALRLQENVVVQPEGRAVQVVADGPISLHGNTLGSRGNSQLSRMFGMISNKNVEADSLTALMRLPALFSADFKAALMSLFGGNVISILSIPSTPSGLYALFDSSITAKKVSATDGYGPSEKRSHTAVDQYTLGLYFYRGEVMIHDNQITFDGANQARDWNMASVTALGVDDISFANNQYRGTSLSGDTISLSHILIVAAHSARCVNNVVNHPVSFLDTNQDTGQQNGNDLKGGHIFRRTPKEYSIGSFGMCTTVSLNSVSGRISSMGLSNNYRIQSDNMQLPFSAIA